MTSLRMAATAGHSALDRIGAWWVASQPGDYDPSSGHGPEWGKAAPAGLLIWLFMGVALFFLIKSMNRHMRRVPKSFDADSTDAAAPDDGDHAGDHAAGDDNGSTATRH